jgi:transposase
MPTSSIRNWMKPEARSKVNGEASKRQPVSEVQAELTRLRREVASLKVDNEILRKAAAYFAKGSR